jgi:hypothetical protein
VGILAVLDRNVVCHCAVWQAQRSDRPRQTAAGRSGDLSRWSCRIRHGSEYGRTTRWPAGAGTRQRHHERRDLRLCRTGLQPHATTQDVHLHLHSMGAAFVCWSSGGSVVDQQAGLAVGVFSRDPFGDLRRRHGVAQPAANDPAAPGGQQRGHAEAGAVLGCRDVVRRHGLSAARWSAAGLGWVGTADRCAGNASCGAAAAHATGLSPGSVADFRRSSRRGVSFRARSLGPRHSFR